MDKAIQEGRCQVFFVGAGPGDPDLITVKGKRCIEEADLVLYAGSLVPEELVSCSKPGARVLDSSSMTLDEIHGMVMDTVRTGKVVARVHTGDPTLYGALKEQMRLLDQEGVKYQVIPGVTAAFATAASAKISLTVPEVTQTLIITRASGRTLVPEEESLKNLAMHGVSMAIYLSASRAPDVKKQLLDGGYPEHTPVIIGYAVGWKDQMIIKGTLSDLPHLVARYGIKRQAVFLITPAELQEQRRSRLYAPEFKHGFRI